MKRIDLHRVEQNGIKFWYFAADPRLICELIPQVDEKQTQEFQRPWLKSRVKEIADYVVGKIPVKGEGEDKYRAKGLIPNAPILNLKGKLKIEKDDEGTFMMIPSSAEESEKYRESIEVIDGQHRIRAFAPEHRSQYFSDNTKYEMVFTMFDRAERDTKNELFMVTNEKQKAVEANLLRSFRKELNLLGNAEEIYDFIVDRLNGEDSSPLKGRIIVGSERVVKGYKENQVEKILQKYRVWETLKKKVYKDQDAIGIIFRTIVSYLRAWERVAEVSFQEPVGTATKISGLRYMLVMLPEILDTLTAEQKNFTQHNVEDVLRDLPNALDDDEVTSVSDIFTAKAMNFRGEGATVKMAKEHAAALSNYRSRESNAFNPLGF